LSSLFRRAGAEEGVRASTIFFDDLLVVLYERYAAVLVKLVELIPTYGSWRDQLNLQRSKGVAQSSRSKQNMRTPKAGSTVESSKRKRTPEVFWLRLVCVNLLSPQASAFGLS
jgi:hypothetical protein